MKSSQQFFLTAVKQHWLLGVCILFIFTVNTVWILRDQSPPWWDIAGHSYRSVQMAEVISHFPFSLKGMDASTYPPFAYGITAIFFLVFGLYQDIPQYSLLAFVGVYMIFLYYIAYHFSKDKSIAILATWLSITFPLVAHFSRLYDLDFPLTALVWAAIALLLRSNHFQNRKVSIAFGITAAFAQLTKWTAVIFLIAPVCFTVWSSIRKNGFKKSQMITMLIVLIVFCIIALPWYAYHWLDIIHSASATRNNIFSVPYEALFTRGNLTFYARWIVRGILWPFAILGGVGIVVLFYKRAYGFAFFLWSFIVPYGIMTFLFYSKESRYMLPLFPLVGIAVATLAGVTMNAKRKTAIALALGAISAFFFVETSFGNYIFPESFYTATQLDEGYGYVFNSSKTGKVFFGFPYPTRYQVNVKDIVAVVAKDAETYPISNGVLRITVVPNSAFLNSQQIIYYARLIELDTLSKPYSVEYALSSEIRIGDEWKEELVQSDYIITKTGDQGPVIWGPKLAEIAEAEAEGDPIFTEQFELIRRFALHGIEKTDTEARLYRKKL